MKNFLLKIILVGLTLGLLPQGTLAMQNTTTQEKMRNCLNSSYQWVIENCKKDCKKIANNWKQATACVTFGMLLAWFLSYIVQEHDVYHLAPTVTPTYAKNLELTSHAFSINPATSFIHSKKYGKIIPIDEQLQDISSNNFTVLQSVSEEQDGPTCAKYAFANLFAIEQLHRNGKAINAKSIADQIKFPLHAIGLPGQAEWQYRENMLCLSRHEQVNWILNYARILFPDNNIHIQIPKPLLLEWRETNDNRTNYQNKLISSVVHDLKTYGISHIMLMCDRHATALSIIRNKKNNYSIVYMDSNNIPLGSQIHTALYANDCYSVFKTLIANLKNQIERNPITIK